MSSETFIETHTFTIIARCLRTGMLGVGVSTSEIGTGSRVPHVKAKVGAAGTQALTDPRLGQLAINLFGLGYSAAKVLVELTDSDPHIARRQLGLVDKDGNSAAHTGSENKDWAGHIAKKNFVAMGNYINGEVVVKGIAEAFESSVEEPLEERLMRAIEGGRDAGGCCDGQRSAAILVYDWEIFPRVNLRVDDHDEPIGELRRILELYKPLIPYYALRPSDPSIGSTADWRQKYGKPKE